MQHINRFSYMPAECPALLGILKGGRDAENAQGMVAVFWLPDAMYLEAEFTGLPPSEVFGLHIHECFICGEARDVEQFSEAGGHYSNCPDGMKCSSHPYHAGDLPPIFSDTEGNANMSVYLDKADTLEISGRTIILHSMKDDFQSQPSGNSGTRIVCGVLAEYI